MLEHVREPSGSRARHARDQDRCVPVARARAVSRRASLCVCFTWRGRGSRWVADAGVGASARSTLPPVAPPGLLLLSHVLSHRILGQAGAATGSRRTVGWPRVARWLDGRSRGDDLAAMLAPATRWPDAAAPGDTP